MSADEQPVDKGVDSFKLLLVDDNLELMDMSAQLFRSFGFEVVVASRAEEALDVLRQSHDIDAMVSDVVMPGMNGMQLGYEARKIQPGIRVILVSGYPSSAIGTGTGELSDFDFLSKPYRVADVVRLLVKGD